MVLVCLALLGPLAAYPNLGRGVQAAAAFAEDMGAAVGTSARAGANITEAMAHLVVATSTAAISIGNTLWKGIDVYNTRIHVVQGKVLIDDALGGASFLTSPAGVLWLNASGDLRERSSALLSTLSWSLPSLSITERRLNVTQGRLQQEL